MTRRVPAVCMYVYESGVVCGLPELSHCHRPCPDKDFVGCNCHPYVSPADYDAAVIAESPEVARLRELEETATRIVTGDLLARVAARKKGTP